MRFVRRTLAAASASALVGALAVGVGVAPAFAAPAEVLVSVDGTTFGTSITENLFEDMGPIIPQDEITASFWVKNPTAESVAMRVSMEDMVASSDALAESVMLTASNSASSARTATLLANLSACDVIVPSQVVPANGVVRVDVGLTMLDVSGQVAQLEFGGFELAVSMRDSEAGPFPPSACEDADVIIPFVPVAPAASGHSLAHTGVDFPTAWLVAGGALVGLGFLLVSRRRRSDAADS